MKKLLRTISLILVFCFLLGAPSCKRKGEDPSETDANTDAAYQDNTDGDFSFFLNDTGATLSSYSGSEVFLEIPETVGGHKVTALYSNLFRKNTLLKEVTIPDSVTQIGESVFAECTHIEKINIPGSVKAIGANAFANTLWFDSLTDEFVIVGDGVVIKYNGTKTDVTIPKGVKYVSNLFRYSDVDIVSVTIPKSVECIGTKAFAGLKSLTSVNISSQVKKISYNAFILCTALEEITVPESVTEIENYAFAHCKNLKKAVINASVKTLPANLFHGCDNLSEVSLPKTLETIDCDLFYSCPSLSVLVFNSGLTDISESDLGSKENLTVVCPEESSIEAYCTEHEINVSH